MLPVLHNWQVYISATASAIPLLLKINKIDDDINIKEYYYYYYRLFSGSTETATMKLAALQNCSL